MNDPFTILPLILPNFFILLGLSALLVFSLRHLMDRPRWQFAGVSGLLFGLAAIALLSYTVPIIEGAFADLRNVFILCAGLLAGPWAATLSALLASLYRISLGGNQIGPVSAILAAALLGGIYYLYRPFPDYMPKTGHLLILALVLALINAAAPWLGWLLGDPIDDDDVLYLSGTILASALVLYPPATLLLVRLMEQEYRRIQNERALAREIAEHRRTEDALQEKHALVETIMNHTPDAIFVHDTKGHLLLSNAADQRRMTEQLQDVCGRSLTAIFPPDVARIFLEEDRQVMGKDKAMFFSNAVETSARLRYYSVMKAPFKDEQGRTIGVLGIARDISEQKQVEIELRENESRFRQLMDHLPEVFWMSSTETNRILYVSPAYENLTGRSCQSLYDDQEQEDPDCWLKIVHPDDVPLVRKIHQRLLSDGCAESKYRVRRLDGTIRWVQSRAFSIRNTRGEVYRLGGIIEDITPLKEAEHYRQRQQMQLAHMSRLTLAGEMASGMAHELNQPLTAIGVYSELSQSLLQAEPVEIDKLYRIEREIAAQAQRAGAIIRWMKDFTRRTQPQLAPADLNALIEESLQPIHHNIHRNPPIGLCLDLEDGLPMVRIEALQIQQVLINLLWNAIEALRESGIKDGELSIRTCRFQDDQIAVEVSDNGPGLPDEALAHLFEPFFTTKSQGTGLGLAISHAIIQAHGGTLQTQPNPDRGVTFRFILPLPKPRGQDRAAPPGQPAASRSPR